MINQHVHVEIESTNLCNTRCLHCPHESISRSTGRMEWSTYQTVLDKIMASTSQFSVEYAGMGEPLLNPAIYDFIRYVSDKGTTSLTTNAAALTQQNIQRLIDAGLARLTISFNGDDSQLYALMMGKLNFERAQENLHAAVKLCQGTHTEVAANVSVTRQTQPRLASIRKVLENAGVTHIFFSKCHSRGGFLIDETICNTPLPPANIHRCDIFSSTLFVAWTGEVLSCCHDLAGINVLGDLKIDPLEPILEKKAQIATQGVSFEICKFCNDLYRFMGDQMFDGRTIGDWVYDLYTGEGKTSEPGLTPLSQFIFSIYAQEGHEQRIISSLVSENQNLKNTNQSLSVQLENIRSTRTWRLLDRIHKVRNRLFS